MCHTAVDTGLPPLRIVCAASLRAIIQRNANRQYRDQMSSTAGAELPQAAYGCAAVAVARWCEIIAVARGLMRRYPHAMRIEAEISDSTHLVLRRPLAMPAGSLVVLELIDPGGDTDREEMVAASVALLARAYGPDEPDYSQAGEPL